MRQGGEVAGGPAGRRGRGYVPAAVLCAVVTGAALLAACGARHPLRAAVAPPTTAAPTTTTIPTTSYTVKYGDDLGSIALRFHVPMATITAANHLANPDKLTIGQVLVIPLPPPPPSTTTTITAPAPPSALKLTVAPPDAQLGAVFTLNLTGAHPGDQVTFEIDSPDGRKFTGQPHTAGTDGTVLATYLTTEKNVAGPYNVIATGPQATSAHASFTIDPSPNSGSTTSTTSGKH